MIGRIMMIGAALAVGGPLAGQQQPPPPTADVPPDIPADIVVTGRRDSAKPVSEAIAYLRRDCFDAARLTRRLSPPEDDPDWEPLDARTRAQFGITDPAVPAYSLVDTQRGRTLVAKFERLALPGRLEEQRCTLVVLGGTDHKQLVGDMSRLFRGPGTQRHVGAAEGVPAISGWRQWVWTGIPARRSQAWRAYEQSGDAGSLGIVRVVDESLFYASNDFILGDLKIKQDSGRPVSILSFAYTTRPR